MKNQTISRILYGWILPITFFVFFLGVSSFVERSILFNSFGIDLIIRIVISIWFSGVYLRLSRIKYYSFYPGKHWSKDELKIHEKFFCIFLCIFFSIVSGIMTWWLCLWFLPSTIFFRCSFTIINSTLIFIPLIKNYWVLKK